MRGACGRRSVVRAGDGAMLRMAETNRRSRTEPCGACAALRSLRAVRWNGRYGAPGGPWLRVAASATTPTGLRHAPPRVSENSPAATGGAAPEPTGAAPGQHCGRTAADPWPVPVRLTAGPAWVQRTRSSEV